MMFSMSLLLENGKSGILHELPVELLELVQGVPVVLRGSLGEDVHSEVGLGDVLVVLVLVRLAESLSLSSEFILQQKLKLEKEKNNLRMPGKACHSQR